MTNYENYQNDVDRLGERVLLVLQSLEDAPDVDKEILSSAGKFLGMGFAALDAAISPERTLAYHEWKKTQE